MVLPIMIGLIWRLRDEDEPQVPWAIGNAIGHLARRVDLDELRHICATRALGSSRQMVVDALRRLRDTESVPLLIELLDDHWITGHAARALAKVGDSSALPALGRVGLDDTHTAWVRREATRAQRMIEKRLVPDAGGG